MVSNNILSNEELEALLTPEELEILKMNQNEQMNKDFVMSPVQMQLALRELEGKVSQLAARLELLEQQSSGTDLVARIVVEQDNVPYIEQQNESYVELEPDLEPILEQLQQSTEDHSTVLEESSSLSRSARHRERKPSILSRLFK